MSNLSWSDKLAAGRLMAIQKWPWMRVAIFSMIPHATENFDTFGVTKDGILVVGIPAAERWSVKEIAAVLVHEVSHLLRAHHDRGNAIKPIKELFGIATDLEINDDLAEAKWELPEGCIYPKQFNFEDGLTAEEYYTSLRQNTKQKTCSKCGSTYYEIDTSNTGKGGSGGKGKKKKQKGSGSGEQGKGGKQQSKNGSDGGSKEDQCPACSGQGYMVPKNPMAGGGWCGSGAGVPLPNEESIKPKGVNARTPVEQQIMRRQVAEEIRREAAKGRGTIPGGWERWAEAQLSPPKINWRTKLARTCRQTVARRAGAVDMAYHKPSRRQGGLGYGTGCAILPAYFKPVPTIAVLVDTSGSMGTKELEEAVNESAGVMKAIGADVQFAALDTAVQTFQKVQHPQQLVPLLKGGGGTDFRVGFEQIDKLPRHEKPKIIVFITDGCGPAPMNPPRGIDTIWVLVGEHQQAPYCEEIGNSITWGEKISVSDDGATDMPVVAENPTANDHAADEY